LAPPFDAVPFLSKVLVEELLAVFGTEGAKEVAVPDKSERTMALRTSIGRHFILLQSGRFGGDQQNLIALIGWLACHHDRSQSSKTEVLG